MEEGFILEDGRIGPSADSWIAGKPQFGFFGAAGMDQHKIVTFACVQCGYLESYIRLPKNSAPA
jgi:hypothetical protein